MKVSKRTIERRICAGSVAEHYILNSDCVILRRAARGREGVRRRGAFPSLIAINAVRGPIQNQTPLPDDLRKRPILNGRKT